MSIFIISSMLLLSGCIGANETTTVTPPTTTAPSIDLNVLNEYLTYENLEYNFKISYPQEWELIEDYTDMIVVAFISPFRGNADFFNESLGVGIQTVPDPSNPISLEQYTELYKILLMASIPNCIIVNEKPYTLAGYPAYIVTHTGTQNMLGFSLSVKTRVCYMLVDNKLYSFIYTASGDDNYMYYLLTITKMIDSFEFM